MARSGDVRDSELRLQRDIDVVRKEIKEVELSLKKEIEVVRKEIKDVELRMRTAMHQQTIWVIGAVGAVVGLVKGLDWLMV
jgi:preprotein translocase subunit SecE